ncbi:MAG: RNA-binding protein [Planctomycetaceae bacterium]|jgi:RNA recognition motif-containing protein|nr:RNA-binding protein [Planctomycetaceae bacterium]
MRIYVGNLNYRTTKEGLRTAFEEFGTVSASDVVTDRATGQSKGFGFVEMPDSAEANAAIDALDGKELDSRTIKVNEAHPATPRQGGNGGGGFRPRGNRDRDSYRSR